MVATRALTAVTDFQAKADKLATINQQTGTSYTWQASDSGCIVEHNNASAIALTLPPTAPVGSNSLHVQSGAGTVTAASSGSGSVVGATTTAGQNTAVSYYVRSNVGGSAAVWVGV